MNSIRLRSCLAALVMLGSPALSNVAFAQADLKVTKTGPDAVAPGAQVVYTVTVKNNGLGLATGVSIADPTPSGLTFSSNAGDCTTTYPCTFATIASTVTKTITTTYNVPANYAPPTAIRNVAQSSAVTLDLVPANNFGIAITPINGINCGNFLVSGGSTHTCSVVSGNGSGSLPDDRLECWGANVAGESIPPTGAFQSVTASSNLHTCGLRSTGAIQCWGSNDFLQVSTTPVATNFVQVDAGFDHTCALDSNRLVTCWGDNTYGQRNAPNTPMLQVASGDLHTCGLTVDGRIECWGDDSFSQVTDAPSGDGFAQIVGGAVHSCALRDNGSVTCWGENGSGQATNQAGPFDFITAGAEHNCGLNGNTATCWGDDSSGQSTPPPSEAFETIDAGAYVTCGVLYDGTILCWGNNDTRQAVPPARSLDCPICGDGTLEGFETCESAGPGGLFADCCSPVSCRPYRQSEAHACRDADGACDAPELCDGAALSCPPPGPPRALGYVCRGSAGGCDDPEVCNGSAVTCPPNEPFKGPAFVCRPVAGNCDFPENCNGSQAACPTDLFKTNVVECRGVAGVCDIAEVCSGSGPACPADIGKGPETTCRAKNGVCDIAEVCNGQPECPTDAFETGAVVCRPDVSICDFPETCTGSTGACPADVLQPNTFVCRPATDACDVDDKCTGASGTCPTDVIATAGIICRASIGTCDITETCTGSAKACPTDTFSASSVNCRVAVDVCDVTEKCTGASNTCPANGFASAATVCNDALFCNGPDNCNGSGACSTHAGNPCPGPDGDANCNETCNEAADSCTTPDPNGSLCSDGDACSTGEICTNGFCGGGTVTNCDDGNLCTFDTCELILGCVYLPGIEDSGCLTPGKGLLLIRDSPGEPDKKLLKWGWKKGEIIAPSLLGAPDVDTDYALCLFDRSGGTTTLVGSYVIPGGIAGWKTKETKNKFVNKDSPPDGIYTFKSKAVALEGKSGAGLKGSGVPLDLPTPAGSQIFFLHEPSMVAQLRNEEGMCLTTEFFGADFKKNSGDQVKAIFKR